MGSSSDFPSGPRPQGKVWCGLLSVYNAFCGIGIGACSLLPLRSPRKCATMQDELGLTLLSQGTYSVLKSPFESKGTLHPPTPTLQAEPPPIVKKEKNPAKRVLAKLSSVLGSAQDTYPHRCVLVSPVLTQRYVLVSGLMPACPACRCAIPFCLSDL